ncbi:hypothetical protein D3C85_1492170 [compost metagenome]
MYQVNTSALDEQASLVAITALTDAQQDGLAARGMLLGDQSDGSCIASAAFELLAITQLGSQDGGGDRADTRQSHQARRQIIFSGLAFHVLIQRLDLLLHMLEMSIQPHQIFFVGLRN